VKRFSRQGVGCLLALALTIGLAGLARGADVDTSLAGLRFMRPCPCPCPANTAGTAATGSGQPSGTAQPGTQGPGGTASDQTPGTAEARGAESGTGAAMSDVLAQGGRGEALASMAQSFAPNMIGDAFGPGGAHSTLVRSFSFSGLNLTGTGSSRLTVSSGSNSQVVAKYNSIYRDTPFYYYQHTFADYNDASGKLGTPNTDVPSGGTLVPGSGNNFTTSGPNDYPQSSSFKVAYQLDIPNPGAGGVVGRTKIGEDTSPMPRDRILFDYNLFSGVPLAPGGVNVHRFTPGFEKTFFDGVMSIEMKVPMAITMDSTVVQDGGTDLSHGEFGNLAITWKALLLQSDEFALSGGLTVTAPTARDTNVVLSDGTQLVSIRNQSTHVGPFLGFLWTPNEKFFAQGFYQVDVETSGCPVSVNPDGSGLQNVGTLHDTVYQYIDLGIGSWLYRGHERFENLTGFAWTLEVHGNDSLKPNRAVVVDNWQIGDYSSIDAWNLTVGSHLEFNNNTTVTMGYSVPLAHDREFNGEFRLMFNHYFGGSTRVAQTPNM